MIESKVIWWKKKDNVITEKRKESTKEILKKRKKRDRIEFTLFTKIYSVIIESLFFLYREKSNLYKKVINKSRFKESLLAKWVNFCTTKSIQDIKTL